MTFKITFGTPLGVGESYNHYSTVFHADGSVQIVIENADKSLVAITLPKEVVEAIRAAPITTGDVPTAGQREGQP